MRIVHCQPRFLLRTAGDDEVRPHTPAVSRQQLVAQQHVHRILDVRARHAQLVAKLLRRLPLRIAAEQNVLMQQIVQHLAGQAVVIRFAVDGNVQLFRAVHKFRRCHFPISLPNFLSRITQMPANGVLRDPQAPGNVCRRSVLQIVPDKRFPLDAA